MHEIRAATPDDKERIIAFLVQVWPTSSAESINRRWWWTFECPPMFVALDSASGAVIGMCVYVPFSIHAGQSVHSAAWFVDFYVLEIHQGKGLGKRLTRAVMEMNAVTASMSQTDAAWEVFSRIGWNERRFVKLYLNPFGLIPGMQRAIRALNASSGSLEIAAHPLPADRNVMGDLDQIWDRCRTLLGPLAVRDAEQINLRFARRDHHQYNILVGYRNSIPCGYLVTRVCPARSLASLKNYRLGDDPIGLIVDYLVDPGAPDDFAALLDAGCRLLEQDGARGLLCLSSLPQFHRILSRRGFLHADSPVIGRKLSRMNVSFTAYAKDEGNVAARDDWFLTLGDCDMDRTWGESPAW